MENNITMTDNGSIVGDVSFSGDSKVHPNFSNAKKYIGWPDWEENVCDICKRLKNRDFLFVYGIPRGGLTLGTQVSHKLGIPLVVDYPAYWMLDWYHWRLKQGIELKSDRRNILIVDSICDTGKTLEYFNKELRKTIKNTKAPEEWNVTAAVIDVDPKAVKLCDEYISLKNPREWIVYPWEVGSKELTNL
jgi:hypoxanthine phosphoribosyltransferase